MNIDLSNLTILTEVASGYFIYTPVIPLLAGASKVYAVVNDSAYGQGENIVRDCKQLLTELNIDLSRIEFAINNCPKAFLQEADIITNSGHLRPLDETKLVNLKPQAVIPIMYEKWELRASDIDTQYCIEKGIKVGGTWENFPGLQIFDFCKHLMLKLIFEAGFEIKDNKIIIFSTDHYGALLNEACIALQAAEVIVTTKVEDIYHNIEGVDFIFFCDYNNQAQLINAHDSVLNLEKLKANNPSIAIIHLAGNIDAEYVNSLSVPLYPNKNGFAQRMTQTLSNLGPTPVLRLLCAGFKVGEELFRNQITTLTQI